MGYSHDSFYRFRDLYEKGGGSGPGRNHPLQIQPQEPGLAGSRGCRSRDGHRQACPGQARAANELKKRGTYVSLSGADSGVFRFFDEHELRVDRVLTDCGAEYCGAQDWHEYELYLAVENIDHSWTKVRSPQTNGICERFNKMLPDEFRRVAFRLIRSELASPR